MQSGSCLIESEAGVLVKVYPTVAHGEQPCLRGKKSQGSPDGSFSLTTSSKMVSAFFPGYGAVRRPLGRRLLKDQEAGSSLHLTVNE